MGYYKDTIGLTIDIECGEDINASTGHILNVKKPNGKWYEWDTNITIQNNTKLRYMTQQGDLDQAGWYLLYPVFILGGWNGAGNPDQFLIEDPQKPQKIYNR